MHPHESDAPLLAYPHFIKTQFVYSQHQQRRKWCGGLLIDNFGLADRRHDASLPNTQLSASQTQNGHTNMRCGRKTRQSIDAQLVSFSQSGVNAADHFPSPSPGLCFLDLFRNLFRVARTAEGSRVHIVYDDVVAVAVLIEVLLFLMATRVSRESLDANFFYAQDVVEYAEIGVRCY